MSETEDLQLELLRKQLAARQQAAQPTPVLPQEFDQSQGGIGVSGLRDQQLTSAFNDRGTGQVQAGEPGFVPPIVEGKGAGFGANFQSRFVDDPETRKRLIAKKLFPGDPAAIQRFGINDGRVFYQDDNGQLIYAESDTTGDQAGRFLSDIPEMIGGALGGALGGVPGAALGSAAGAAAKKSVANLVFDEPQSALGNAGDIALEAALGAAGQKGGDVVSAKLAKSFPKIAQVKRGRFEADPREVQAIARRIKANTGIDVDVAQVTNLASMKSLKTWATNHPSEAADIMRAQVELQEGQVEAAIESVLSAVTKESDRVSLGTKGINAAKAAIENAKTARGKAVEELYDRAYLEAGHVDIDGFLSEFDALIAKSAGVNKRKLLSLKGDFLDKETKEAMSDLEPLHEMRKIIDDLQDTNPANSAGKSLKKRYGDVRQSLDKVLKASSESFRQADEVFTQISKETVEPLEDSVVGVLAKLKPGKETSAALTLFNTRTVDPTIMRFAKNAIAKENPEAWDGIVKLWLIDEFDKAFKVTQSGARPNVAGKFRQNVEGGPRKRAAIMTALKPSARKVFADVMEALEMVSRTPTGGSNTAEKLTREKALDEGFNRIRRTITSPIDAGVEAGKEAAKTRHAIKIAEGLTDPAKIRQITELKRLKNNTQRNIAILGLLGISSTGRAGAEALAPIPDELPPTLNQP